MSGTFDHIPLDDRAARREQVLHDLRVMRLKRRAAIRGRVAGRWVIVR